MLTILKYIGAFLVGVPVGAYLWNKYKANAAADLAAVQQKIGG